jgi:hypothetical protein
VECRNKYFQHWFLNCIDLGTDGNMLLKCTSTKLKKCNMDRNSFTFSTYVFYTFELLILFAVSNNCGKQVSNVDCFLKVGRPFVMKINNRG